MTSFVFSQQLSLKLILTTAQAIMHLPLYRDFPGLSIQYLDPQCNRNHGTHQSNVSKSRGIGRSDHFFAGPSLPDANEQPGYHVHCNVRQDTCSSANCR